MDNSAPRIPFTRKDIENRMRICEEQGKIATGSMKEVYRKRWKMYQIALAGKPWVE